MRNLKKLLALVLAMMMAFSLMLTANAANPVRDYPDADQADEAFEEAIDVLTGMKVYSGDNGNFKPAATITRAEVAALIYRLASGDVDDSQATLYAEYGNFPDVPHDAWYAGYVGYCANAGYIKGRPNGNFDPSGNVTGYEALAMILRAIGYDRNGEFTGATWQTEVSALSQQLGILDNVKTTQYGGTLYLPARRDVVADLLFRADAYVPMVVYTPALGYQPYGMVTGDNNTAGNLIGQRTNPTLGKRIFGLTWDDDGILLGNEQTGEAAGKSVLGYSSKTVRNKVTGEDVTLTTAHSAYAWNGAVLGQNTSGQDYAVKSDVTYTLKTGIGLVGHSLGLWFDDGSGSVSKSGKPVYAYFDQAKTAVVRANDTDLTQDDDSNPNNTTLAEAIIAAGMKVASNDKAVFNNSFGLFGQIGTVSGGKLTDATNATTDNDVSNGNGVAVTGENTGTSGNDFAYHSPVNLYKVIDNNSDNVVDAVIALNIESSQVTESNTVNRVPTIGLPVRGSFANASGDNTAAIGTQYILGDTTTGGAAALGVGANVKQVPTGDVLTGVIAKDALVGDSVSTLGDYEMGIHITGTTPRTVLPAETKAINGTGAETAYYLLHEVTATVTGTVVAYNRNAGTVTLDNGTVLERSKFYNTVAIKNTPSATVAPDSAIPQGWVYDASISTGANGTGWVEGYANTSYKFYTDYEGKYLGAERGFGSTFLYGTYLDYDQKVSTSTFNYYLTGVTMDGEIETVQVNKYWQQYSDGNTPGTGSALTFPRNKNIASVGAAPANITGTDLLGIPFRDTYGGTGSVNGIGNGAYTGFAINGTTVDSIVADPSNPRQEYLDNIARLGIKYAGADVANGTSDNAAFDIREIDISNDDVTLGARETIKATEGTASNKYFTEATKFILVEGFGTDSVKATVYEGISKLKGSAAHVFIKMNGDVDATGASTTIRLASGFSDFAANTMTYYTESPYTYAQSGDVAMKIDTIILPAKAVSWSGGSGLYYVGNPGYKSINSWGTDAWKYDLYEGDELHQVWLTNDPTYNTDNDAKFHIVKDSFYNLKDTGLKANDGQPIYTAGHYDTTGVWYAGVPVPSNDDPTANAATFLASQYTMSSNRSGSTDATTSTPNGAGVRYSAVTRDAQTATFVNRPVGGAADTVGQAKLYRVAEAKVVNLNKDARASGAAISANGSKSGEIWPGITSLPTLNEAGSIDPVTGRPLKVAAVVDPQNPLVVTTIYVCYEQDWN